MKTCATCVNKIYDKERAKYFCWLTNEILYNDKEECEDHDKYVPTHTKLTEEEKRVIPMTSSK